MTKKTLTRSGVATLYILIVVIVIITFLSSRYVFVNQKYIGKSCGGLAANLPNRQCPIGLRCVLSASFPDADGQCQYILPFSLILSKTEIDEKTTEVTKVDQFCGGIANISCPKGYKCTLDGKYPDAGGKCDKLR